MNSSSMLSLPAIVHGPNRWRLPLCDATAMAVALALADETPAAQAEPARALAADPALAVWGVWSALLSRSGDAALADMPKTIDGLSTYLLPRLFQLFVDDPSDIAAQYSPDQHGRFAALVAESVTAAHEALRA